MRYVQKYGWYTAIASALFFLHVLCVAVLHLGPRVSNILQLTVGLLGVLFCCTTVRSSQDRHIRSLWLFLSGALSLWVLAQAYFVLYLFLRGKALTYPSAADALWLSLSLPILLVVVRQRTRDANEWITWLDVGQASLLFSLLSILVFSREAGLSITQAYDAQGGALVLLCGLRYSRSDGPDRVFFRNLGIYLLSYSALSSLNFRLVAHGCAPGGSADLCWTLPFVLFIIFSDGSHRRFVSSRKKARIDSEVSPSTNLYGTSALGLYLISLLFGLLLHQRKPLLGFLYIVVASVLFAVRIVHRESQIFIAHRALREACVRDALTGLPNRSWLMDDSENEVVGNDVFLLCNLDRFKLINDSIGRVCADKLLISVVQRIQASTGIKHLYRVGGDEFVAIVKSGDGCPDHVGNGIVGSLREPFSIDHRSIALTATIGIAAISPDGNISEGLARADAALVYGKQHGSNQCVQYTEDMVRDAAAELAFQAELKTAIYNGEIINHYQAIYSTDTKEIVGFEALARWMQAGRVVATPAEFIPIAEDTWMIIDMGRRLLSQACDDAALFAAEAKRPIWISVNLSGKQLKDPTLVRHIQAEVLRSGISMASLKLEVTESVLLDDFALVIQILDELRAMGIRIALDDFGTGYSSLSYLSSLPFDVLKVDRSFVKELKENTQRFTITNAIVQLATALDKVVVAEGVETLEEEELLTSVGCTLLQGYRISRPLPATRAIELTRPQPTTCISTNGVGFQQAISDMECPA